MELGPNIAHNEALRENVFMMTICVELRIPLFVVGKPGSSKSLAKSVVAESMRGRNSEKPFLKMFKSVSGDILIISIITWLVYVTLPTRSKISLHLIQVGSSNYSKFHDLASIKQNIVA